MLKKIILILLTGFLLTGCTAKTEETIVPDEAETTPVYQEEEPNPAEMSLDEVEENLEELESKEFEADLEEIGEEL